jgi:C1A family cysteine protease
MRLGYIPWSGERSAISDLPTGDAPDWTTGWNWVDHGAVTPVKDQGQCGGCWSFSSTGALEGAWKIKSGQLLSFSEQELIDCVGVCFGCGGGTFFSAFRWYNTHFPMSEASYPY